MSNVLPWPQKRLASADLVDDRVVRFTISTGAVDRDNDVIDQRGWQLEHYRRNPVVLWGHDSRSLQNVIGRCVEIGVVGGALKAAVEFAPTETAEAALRLCRAQFLNATSVGFRPLEWEFTSDKARGADDWFPGIDFRKQELLELSIVAIPANPEALIDRAPGLASASRQRQRAGVRI